MSGLLPQEERDMPFGDYERDETTNEEYANAIAELNTLIAADSNMVTSLAELSAVLGNTGENLHTLLQAKGTVQVMEFAYRKPGEEVDTAAVDRARIIRKDIGDYEIFMSSDESSVYCEAYKIDAEDEQKDLFSIKIPRVSLQRSGNPLKDAIIAHCIDRRGDKTVQYNPVAQPHVPDSCQGYLKITQEFTRRILGLVPTATKEEDLPSV